MTTRELRKLSRGELMELLLAQGKEIQVLKERLDKAEKALENREIQLRASGTLAEAALRLNGVFEAADKACQQYMENVQRLAREQEKWINETYEKKRNTLSPRIWMFWKRRYIVCAIVPATAPYCAARCILW